MYMWLFTMWPNSPNWELETIHRHIFVIHFHILTIFGHKIANGNPKEKKRNHQNDLSLTFK